MNREILRLIYIFLGYNFTKLKNTYNLFDGTFCLLCCCLRSIHMHILKKSENFRFDFCKWIKRDAFVRWDIMEHTQPQTHTHTHSYILVIFLLPMHFSASFTKPNPFSKQIILLIIAFYANCVIQRSSWKSK